MLLACYTYRTLKVEVFVHYDYFIHMPHITFYMTKLPSFLNLFHISNNILIQFTKLHIRQVSQVSLYFQP
jgi:hypothetical protein